MVFGLNLRRIRHRQGLSQKQLADYLSISPQSISKWEKGDSLPSIDYLPKIAELLKCDINDFFAPIAENDVDSGVFNDFLALMANALNTDYEKNMDEIEAFVREHPSVIDESEGFCQKIMSKKTLSDKTLQEMLSCSHSESLVFIEYLSSLGILEELDTDGSYFVVEESVIGLILLIKLYKSLLEKSSDDNIDLADSFMSKIKDMAQQNK